MTESNTQLAVIPYSEMRIMAEDVHASKMLGTTSVEQVLVLMGICQAEGLHPMAAQKRYHIIEGKPSMRADAMTGEYKARGGRLVWHIRTDEVCAATFFDKGVEVNEEAIKRGRARCRALMKNDLEALIDLSMMGEETILRTYADCQEKGLTEGRYGTKDNWKKSPRQMLTARVETEAIRLVDPGLVAGIYSEDEVHQILDSEPEQRLTNDERIVAGEAKRLESNGIDPEKAQRFQPEEKAKEDSGNQEKPVSGTVIEPKPDAHEPKPESNPKPDPKEEEKPAPAAGKYPCRFYTMEADQLPAGETWRAHVINCVGSKGYKGRRLDDFNMVELKNLQEGWVVKFAESIAKVPEKVKEAELVTLAFEYRKAQASGELRSDEEIGF